MAYKPIIPAEPRLADDGATPYSPAFDDVYHSASGGLEQARQVFLQGNGLLGENPRWQDKDRFVIVETGFGLGLNFLATWQAWRKDPKRCRRLHFVSVEKHPLTAADLARHLAPWPELADLAAQLVAAWPLPLPGLHRLHFDNDVTLTLGLGDASELLPQLRLRADAIYLDGFSPAKNPELWSPQIAADLGKLAAPGATLATWSVAEEVMATFSAAGFVLTKQPGFGTKRYRLEGRWPGEWAQTPPADRRVLVVGAGAAGAFAARALTDHGYRVVVLEGREAPGQGASGNKAGVFRPLPSLGDGRLSRLLRASFLYGRRRLQALAPQGARFACPGALQVGRDERHEETQRRAMEEQQPPAEYCRYVEREEASRLAGWPVARGGWWFPLAGWANPPSLCTAALTGIELRCRAAVARIDRRDGLWRAWDADDRPLAEAPVLVLANGIDAPALAAGHPLPVRVARGLVSHIPEADVPPFGIVATRSGYVTPAVDGIHCAGATNQEGDLEPEARLTDHEENLGRLEAVLPGYAQGILPAQLAGRVGFRPLSPDKLPMVGPLSASDGLYAVNGFGARGLVFAALCGELLACRVSGEPLPLEGDLADALDPRRFAKARNKS